MTDAERTPEQGEPEQTEQTGGGLLSRLLDTAKSVAETVVDTAKNVVGAGSDAAAQVTERVQTTVAQATETPPANDAMATPDAQPATGVAQVVKSRVYDVATQVGDVAQTVAAQAGDVASTVADNVSGVVEAVRTRLSRVYDVVTGEAGASYTPPTEGDKDKEKGGGRPRRFKDVQPGMQLDGKVTSIALYGIFVDVGVGRDGLVHISEMSDKRIESPTEIVEIGTPVTVWVKSVDPDARRISLTMRDPNRQKPERSERRQPRKPEVDREKLASLRSGMDVEGSISSVAPFGAFVDIGVGKDGLVHISELAEGRVERPEDAVQIGQRYTFRILEVDPEGNRISLSLRRAQRASKMQQLEPGTQMDGTISGLAPFGAFVDIGVGRDGLVHVSELSSERVNKVEDVVQVGDKVQVKVIEVDPNSKRISLTMRVDEPPPAERPRPAPRAGGFGGEASGTGGPATFGGGSSFGGGSDRPSSSFGGGAPRSGFGGGSSSSGGRPAFGDGGAGAGDRSRSGDRSRGRGADRGGAVEEDRPGAPPRRGGGGGGGRGDNRGDNRGGNRGGSGRRDVADAAPEVYTFDTPEEEFTGDASLQDLLSKFNSGKGRDTKRTRDEGGDETEDQRRNDAIQRTLAMRDEE